MKRYSSGAMLAGVAVWAIAGSAGAHAQAAAGAHADTVRLTVAAEGNEARYRVREQLAGLDFPNDAVGKTASVTGALVLDGRGGVISGQSEFTIDLSTLASDREMRDNYLRRNTLLTAQHPRAVFVPTAVRGLPWPLPATGSATLRLEGNLTLRDVTKPVVWDVTASFAGGTVTGLAQTKFTFTEFGLAKPRVARVLSVEDDIQLEYEFRLERKP